MAQMNVDRAKGFWCDFAILVGKNTLQDAERDFCVELLQVLLKEWPWDALFGAAFVGLFWGEFLNIFFHEMGEIEEEEFFIGGFVVVAHRLVFENNVRTGREFWHIKSASSADISKSRLQIMIL